MGALLLWLHIYPMGGQDVKITFTQDQGWGTNDVGVLLDHTQHIAEFTIGSVIFAGNTASVSMFGIPTLPASLLLKTPEFDCLEWRGDI